MQVLVVDDVELARVLARRVVERAGATVQEAASGDEARALLLAREARVDLLVTDVQMPGDIDGLALAAWAASLPVPVVVVSGDDASIAAARGIDGVVDAVHKAAPDFLARLRAAVLRVATGV